MSLDYDSTVPLSPAEAADVDDGLASNWGERIIVTVATGLAVLVVAAVTVLMGMN